MFVKENVVIVYFFFIFDKNVGKSCKTYTIRIGRRMIELNCANDKNSLSIC